MKNNYFAWNRHEVNRMYEAKREYGVHPSDEDILKAMERVQSGHKTGHTPKTTIAEESLESAAIQ